MNWSNHSGIENETRLWQSEFWGKWFTAAILAYRYRPEARLKQVLNSAVAALIATQSADGYIGNYKLENRLEQWDIWGRKYCLLGLLDYYDLGKDKGCIDAAVKLADHLIKEINERDGLIVNKGNYRGMAASSVLEPIVKLYRATGNKKYLSFAEEIVRQWETPGGPQLISKAGVNVAERFPTPKSWYSWEQGQKAYEMMSCYEGLLELYRVTGKQEYKRAVQQTWDNILQTEINIAGSGASAEMWFGGRQLQTAPVEHSQETCVTVTWIKLSQQLFRLTGDAKYADAIETSYYNALMAALNTDGSEWAKYTPLNGQRLPGSGQCGIEILNCCVASGPRGQFTLPFTSVMATSDGISINFFNKGTYELKSPAGRKVILQQATSYPVSSQVDCILDLVAPEKMNVRIRIPSWSKQTGLIVNGEKMDKVTPGQFFKINRLWSAGDKISLQLDMRGRVEVQGTDHKFVGVSRGPMVMAIDFRFARDRIGNVNKPVADADGYIPLTPANQVGEETWMKYTALFLPESYAQGGPRPIEIILCDYASAGNGKEPSNFQVWMPQMYSPRGS